MSLYRYKMIVSYDGADYYGWQRQGELPSIEQTLIDTFKKTFATKIDLIGASRTDAGVHALGQVVLGTTALLLQPNKMMEAWNNLLPRTIVVRSIDIANPAFHPQDNVRQKTYWYHFFTERPLPFFSRYGYYCRLPLSLEKLKAGIDCFVGTHDFRSFITTGEDYKSTVKTIDNVKVEYVEPMQAYRITVQGHSFLRHMVRRIVGACLHIATHDDLAIDSLKKALAEKDPNQTLPSAPTEGLLLQEIEYHRNAK